MKGFHRDNQLFSLCGLNCGLCPMHLNKYCPGCGGGEGNQSCKIAKCSLEHDGVEYCFRCREYPCEKYEHIDEFDSFITHSNRKADLKKNSTTFTLDFSIPTKLQPYSNITVRYGWYTFIKCKVQEKMVVLWSIARRGVIL